MKTRDKFSPYSLHLYDAECAKQYYFEYLDAYTSDFRNKPQLKQALVEDGRSKDLVFGDVVHRILNDFFHLPQEERTGEALIDLLEKTWAGPRGKGKGFPEIEDERTHFKRARELLRRFAKEQNLNPEIAYLPQTEGEGEFVKENLLMFPLEPGIILQGKVDRIDREEEGYHLIDYKTSRSEAHENLQLLAYAILSRQALGKPITKASYLYLETGNFKTFTVTVNTEEETRQRILEMVGRIKADQEFAPRPGRRCYWCPYVEFCPAKDEANKAIAELRQKKGETGTVDLPF
ncbi:MAG: PD-(D/E)XK nuclease family protein [Patescibacteria group bacterium]